jgi:hypothetical protein
LLTPDLLLFSVGATTYHFKFKVPESYTDVIGEKVIMQWRYVTANSCQPEGYKNSDISTYLLSKGWLRAGGTLRDCVEPYYQDGSRSETSPEQVSDMMPYIFLMFHFLGL